MTETAVVSWAVMELAGADLREGCAVYVAVRRQPPPATSPPLPAMIGWIARLGGHWSRKGDGPPVPRPCGLACSALVISPGGCNWRLISICNQSLRDVYNGQLDKRGDLQLGRRTPSGQRRWRTVS